MSKPVMISVSGIRGIVGEGLSPELIVNFAAAAGTMYGKGKVMVGRDSRVTGEMVKNAVFSALMSVGCDPIDLGICTTPTVELAVQHSDAVGGIIITASHNPAEWNALKLLGPDGLFLDAAQGEKVKAWVDTREFGYVPWDQIGKADTCQNATQDHIDRLLDVPLFDVGAIQNRKFKIAIDCVNGAGGTIFPDLLKKLNCEVASINSEPTGRFAHTPEPVPANLVDLCQLVKNTNADIGFAVDPDADRLALVSDRGIPLGEEYTLALAVKYRLGKKKGPVVINASTSRMNEDIAEQFGCPLIRTKVGEIHVAKRMQAENAVIGGEGNGGVLLPELHLGRDAPLAALITLQHLLEHGDTITSLADGLPKYMMTKSKIEIGNANPDVIIEAIQEKYKDEKLDLMDGLKIEYEKSWVQVRKSNTEPIIRIMSEAPDQAASEKLCNQVIADIQAMM